MAPTTAPPDAADRRTVLDAVEAQLDAHVRPFLKSHAGGVRVEQIDANGALTVAFEGACACCPLSGMTFYGTVEPTLAQVDGVVSTNPPTNVNISRAAAVRVAALSRRQPVRTEEQS